MAAAHGKHARPWLPGYRVGLVLLAKQPRRLQGWGWKTFDQRTTLGPTFARTGSFPNTHFPTQGLRPRFPCCRVPAEPAVAASRGKGWCVGLRFAGLWLWALCVGMLLRPRTRTHQCQCQCPHLHSSRVFCARCVCSVEQATCTRWGCRAWATATCLGGRPSGTRMLGSWAWAGAGRPFPPLTSPGFSTACWGAEATWCHRRQWPGCSSGTS